MLSYIQLASEVADLSTDRHRKAFVGAVAIRSDGVIVSSRNGYIINPSDTYPSAHAEARVLRKAGYGCTLYVARVKRDGSLAMAKPCSTCHSMIKSRGVKSVYYSVSNTEWQGLVL